MNRFMLSILLLAAAALARAQEPGPDYFGDQLEQWAKAHRKSPYARCQPSEYRLIADNMVAAQNADGGWPKNFDWLAERAAADSLLAALDAKHRLSTLDNKNVYSQVEFLSDVYALTQDTTYREASRRGMEYMLRTQYPNGGWRGWDADAVTFNDDIMYGVLATWQEVLSGKPRYAWVDDSLRARIEASWTRGIELVLRCQYVRNGVRTIWAQQYDHETLQPVKARKYELPGLTASESADIVLLLMRIKYPSSEVVEAVEQAVAWFDRSKIEGIRIETVEVPEAEREDPKIGRDRRVVADPEAEPLWARYYELESNRPFFCRRDGVKVYTLAEVPAERRVGYTWYGDWGRKVLKKYPEWKRKTEKNLLKKRKEER